MWDKANRPVPKEKQRVKEKAKRPLMFAGGKGDQA